MAEVTAEEFKAGIDELKTQHTQAKLELEASIKADNKAGFDAANKKIDDTNKKINELEAQMGELTAKADSLEISVRERNRPAQKTETVSFESRLKMALEEKSDDFAKLERKEIKGISIELKAVGDMSTSNVTGGNRYGQIMAPGIIYNPNRKVHMDQILPGGQVGYGNSFTFMREKGQGEGSIGPVAEGGTKPQFDLDLEESTVQIETIAGWLRFTRKAMTNIPGFISFLMNRLPEKFRKVLDYQTLYGPGTSNNLKGILTSGNFVASTSTLADPLIEKLITDIAVLEDTYERDANGILLRPIDYYSFFKNKASGSGEYDLPMGVTFENGQLRVLGVPAWASTAINSPDYVVGDFQNGAQLLTQEAMHIEFFLEDGTNVRENKITTRIEGNYALPVYGPDYFIKGTTATS